MDTASEPFYPLDDDAVSGPLDPFQFRLVVHGDWGGLAVDAADSPAVVTVGNDQVLLGDEGADDRTGGLVLGRLQLRNLP